MKIILFLVYFISLSIFGQMDYSPGFEAGKPMEMSKLEFLIGDWQIDLHYPGNKSGNPDWKYWTTAKSSNQSLFNGTYIFEASNGFPIHGGHEGFNRWEYKAVFSYDRFQNKYRYIIMDNILGLLDLYEGNYNADGHLILTNTSTFSNLGDNRKPQISRMIISDVDIDKFTIIWQLILKEEYIKNENAEWKWSVKMNYKRKKK